MSSWLGKNISNGDAFVVDLTDREKSYFRIEMWERPGDVYDQIFNPTSIELLNNGYFELPKWRYDKS